MIDQAVTLATLKKHRDRLEEAFTAFNTSIVKTPVGPSFSSERWGEIYEVLRQWQEALDTSIQAGLTENVNGFFHDQRFAKNVTQEVNVYLRSVIEVFKIYKELLFRLKAVGFDLPAVNFETVLPYLTKFGNLRSLRQIGKLADYLPAALLQFYKDHMVEQRRKKNWWLLGISCFTVITAFVLSYLLGQQTRSVLAVQCALGLGGMVAAVCGLSAGKLRTFNSPLAGTSLGIAVTIFFILNPLIVEEKFNLQFVFKRPDQSPILQHLEPGLKVGSGITVVFHPHDGIYYKFPAIPVRYKNKQIDLMLYDSKWMFHNGKTDTTITLTAEDNQTMFLTLIRDPATLTVHGKLPVSAPVRMHVEGYPSLSKNTDSTGSFSFRMPDSFEGDYVKVYYQNNQGAREERTFGVDKMHKHMPQETHH
ncbi:MAG: hypothetical protein J7621_05950 [Niastella sp.]|nr:hypothetical protein [Niastella sp.]